LAGAPGDHRKSGSAGPSSYPTFTKRTEGVSAAMDS
jgi:hypothetical protein